uniref:VWFA domain-containing protein n=1 Tax=Strongyloides stercoralis TaxID=6248 RepID=A0A0K0EIP5_STRER
MNNWFIVFICLTVLVKNCFLKVTVSKLNNINSHISSNCFTQNNEIKNTIPYSDCNTDVTLAVDSSTDSLLPILFSDYEEGLIKNNITSNWTDFSNVNLVWYSENPNVHMTIGTMETRSNFEFILSLIKQSSGSNLDKLIEKLLNIPQTSGNNVSTFIFIAQYYKNNMENTYKNIQLLKQKGSVNFIILGNVAKIQDLEPLQPSNIFYWNFYLKCIPLILQFFQNSLTCNN